MLVSRNWLQHYFDSPLPAGSVLADLLMQHAFEIEETEDTGNDFLIDIDVLPNRAHDCLSHQGIAREISVLANIPLRSESTQYASEGEVSTEKSTLAPRITIEDEATCRRYTSRIIEGVQVDESPDWLRQELAAIGQKSINNIVDATNYILFDTGQPVHIFDLDKLAGNEIIIRNAKGGEKITTLSGEEKTLDPEMLVIADSAQAIAIAGVKGGISAEVDRQTKNILIEVANFEPISVRKTRQKLALLTDASKRFENELSPEYTETTMELLTRLVLSLAGNADTRVGDVIDAYPFQKEVADVPISISLARTNNLLGTTIDEKEIENIFDRFNFPYTTEGDVYTVTVPYARYDLRIEEDLIEEIGRVYGYNNIATKTVDEIAYTPRIHALFLHGQHIRNILVERGYTEVETYMFQSQGDLRVANPIAEDKPYVRDTLISGMEEALAQNIKNAELFGLDVIKLFEIGKIIKEGKEYTMLSLGVRNVHKQAKKQYGEEHEQVQADIAGLAEALHITLPAADTGMIEIDLGGALSPLAVPEGYGDVLSPKSYADTDRYTPFSPYPFALRDISLWTEGKDVEEIISLINAEGGTMLVRTELFDTFSKEGKTSYAFRLVFQSEEGTLSDNTVNEIMEKIQSVLVHAGCEIR